MKIGKISDKDEFFYPDTVLEQLPKTIDTFMAKNAKKGIQLAFELNYEKAKIEIEIEDLDYEIYQMKAIPVEYNTGDGVSQGGDMVVSKWESHMSEYATRKAPFYVYDCLIRKQDGIIKNDNNKAFTYICLISKQNTRSGIKKGKIKIIDNNQIFEIALSVKVYDVTINTNNFFVTNWFSLRAIKDFHKNNDYYEMVRKYAKAMKRTHQTSFFLELDNTCIKDKENVIFDFNYLTPIIKIFKEEQINTIEIGKILSRGNKSDGMPDMYTDTFRCEMYPNIDFDTDLGQNITHKYVKTLADYLTYHNWDNDILFHIHDEPDVHYKNDECLEKRKIQYKKARDIVLEYLPKAQIIEAVGTEKFMNVIDILTPVTSTYEKYKHEFDTAKTLDKKLWNYVCCGPSGKWLNRFLDIALIKGRILFWGFAKNDINGYLHWGFNCFAEKMNPYEATSCHNPTGIGTNFPCGDAFIVYPGNNEVHISMRLEAQRKGAEDASLINKLINKNPEKAYDLIKKVFISNYEYNDDPNNFSKVYESLLIQLEKK